MLKNVGRALRIISDDEKEKIAIIVDEPTIATKFSLTNLEKIKSALKQIGTTRVGKLITDKQLTIEESELINSVGFQEEIVGSDVDIHVALNLLNLLNSKSIDVIGVATTNPNLFPVFSRIKKEKKLLIITYKENITPAIESIADYILELDYFT